MCVQQLNKTIVVLVLFFSIYGFFLVCFYLLKAAAGNVSGIRLNCQKFEQENKMSSYIYIYALYQGITMITLLYVDDAKFCKCNCGCQGMITVFLADLDAHQPRRTILNSVFQDDCVNNNMVVGWHMCSWD